MEIILTVVIVNWNTKHLLKSCLESIRSATENLVIEIIVVDNGSTDGSVEMCERNYPKVNLIKNTTNMGFGRANNQGIIASKSELILLLNSDTVIFPNSLEILVKRMSKDLSIGVIGPRLIYPDGRYQKSCMNFPNLKIILVERLLLYKISSKMPRSDREPPYLESPSECGWIIGACMLIRKKALETTGLFDPNIWMYGEEMDLCFRIKKTGWKIVFLPDAKIMHLGGESWKGKSHSPTFPKMDGLLYYFRKNYDISTYFIVWLLSATGAVLRLLLWAILYLSKKNERARILSEIKSNLLLLNKCMKVPPLRMHFDQNK